MCFTWSVSWWGDYLSVDGVFHLSLIECFIWSVSWWCDIPVSWWSVFHLVCQLMESVSLDLSVDGDIYLLVDGVFHLICQLMGWYTCQLMECVSPQGHFCAGLQLKQLIHFLSQCCHFLGCLVKSLKQCMIIMSVFSITHTMFWSKIVENFNFFNAICYECSLQFVHHFL